MCYFLQTNTTASPLILKVFVTRQHPGSIPSVRSGLCNQVLYHPPFSFSEHSTYLFFDFLQLSALFSDIMKELQSLVILLRHFHSSLLQTSL